MYVKELHPYLIVEVVVVVVVVAVLVVAVLVAAVGVHVEVVRAV